MFKPSTKNGSLALLRAVRRGDTALVSQLLDQGANPNQRDEQARWDESTPLHVASKRSCCSLELMRMLLDGGANPNVLDAQSMRTPMLVAASQHALEKMNLLYTYGADPRCVSESGYNAVVSAAYGPQVSMEEAFMRLFEWGVPPDQCTDYGESALSVCSRRGFFAAIRLLLDRGADPEPLAWSALHQAVAFGGLCTEETLLELCGDINSVDNWGRTPFHIAVAANDIPAMQWLLDAGSDPQATWRSRTSLDLAAQSGSTDALQFLLKLGMEPDTTWTYETPLMTALAHDTLECARILIAAGAALNHRANLGHSPVHCAISPAGFQLLLDAGANINVVSEEGSWPLKYAAWEGDPALTRLLLKNGAQPDLTSAGETALHDAVRSDSLETVTLLLDAGADPNAQDVDGWTPLFCLQSPEMARLMRKRGADPTIPDQIGELPTSYIMDREIRAALQ